MKIKGVITLLIILLIPCTGIYECKHTILGKDTISLNYRIVIQQLKRKIQLKIMRKSYPLKG